MNTIRIFVMVAAVVVGGGALLFFAPDADSTSGADGPGDASGTSAAEESDGGVSPKEQRMVRYLFMGAFIFVGLFMIRYVQEYE